MEFPTDACVVYEKPDVPFKKIVSFGGNSLIFDFVIPDQYIGKTNMALILTQMKLEDFDRRKLKKNGMVRLKVPTERVIPIEDFSKKGGIPIRFRRHPDYPIPIGNPYTDEQIDFWTKNGPMVGLWRIDGPYVGPHVRYFEYMQAGRNLGIWYKDRFGDNTWQGLIDHYLDKRPNEKMGAIVEIPETDKTIIAHWSDEHELLSTRLPCILGY
jgi:hypothetical protein